MKTKQATHTPTPWSTTGFSVRSPLIKREVMDLSLSGKTSEPHFEEITSSVARCKTKEDAAFIVRAVNSHEELLANLRTLNGLLEQFEDMGKLTASELEALKAARLAIAKAEGK